MRVRLTPEAGADLEEISAYISRDNPAAARAVIQDIEDAFETLSRYPDAGVAHTDRPGVRVKLPRRYPAYRIFYALEHGEIVILHVRHAARQE